MPVAGECAQLKASVYLAISKTVNKDEAMRPIKTKASRLLLGILLALRGYEN
jgi:hypothetical protein